MDNRKKGVLGEVDAVEYLKKIGYVILDRNYTTPLGEIDIVARDGDTIVFIEVKARLTDKYGRPIEAITPHKIKTIIKCAKMFLVRYRLYDRNVRFDVIEIMYDELEHVKNAFDGSG
jgi:putative endonuclease